MARSLSLILSTILVASSLVQCQSTKRGLFPRAAIQVDMDICYGNGWQNDVTTRFTGIFFGDFYTGGGNDILGGLAVEGNFHAPNYVINANHGADCSTVNSLNSYGLVVGGTTDTTDTQVHGNAFLNLGGTVDQVKELNNGCFVTADAGTGIFDFKMVQEMAILSNEDFALLEPTAQLQDDGTMIYFRGNDLLLYEVLDFHSCASRICGHYTVKESNPNAIFFGEGNWNGVQGSTIDPLKTYVLNLPVFNGDTITIDSNNPSLGFNPCRLIYNFYPVDARGHYMPTGEFTLLRKTANQFGGFTLAPRGHIIDSSIGNFAGNIVGLDYTWENLNAGVEIHDYHAAGGDCDYYLGCVPVHISTTPTAGPTSVTPSIYSSIDSTNSSQSTHKTISWSRPIFTFSTLNTCTSDYTTTETDTVTATATDTITETAAGTTATVTETLAEHTVTKTSSFTETDLVTTTLVIIKPTIYVRTVTETVTASDCSSSCNPDHTVTVTDQTVTVTDQTVTSTETSECESHKHHHTSEDHSGHHHGPDEECDEEDEDKDEDEDDEDDEDDEEDHKHKHKKNYNDDEDDEE